MRSESLARWQWRYRCCWAQPRSARPTRFSLGSVPPIASAVASVQQPAESQQPGSGVAIALGNALDAAPEAMVLGVALRDPVPIALTIAFSLSNLPVALSSTAGMRAAGRSYSYIFLLWIAIAIGAAVAIAAGYVGFGALGRAWPPRLQAFGAGALLAMAAETMIPEAFHNSPRFSGLLAAFGFVLLLLVDATTG